MELIKLKMARSLGLLLIVLLVSNSCTDDVEKQNKLVARQIDTSDPLLQFITEEVGFLPDDVVDYGDKYVAEGDIMFDKATYKLPASYLESDEPGDSEDPVTYTNPPGMNRPGGAHGRTQQAATGYLYRVGRLNLANIVVSIHSSIPKSGSQNIRPYINEAIQRWNNVGCSEVKFTLATGSVRGHIQIRDDGGTLPEESLDPNDEGDSYAWTDFPSESNHVRDLQFNGMPGRTIEINGDLVAFNYPNDRKATLIMHELGHAIGMRHTDYRWADAANPQGIVWIPGTPDYAPGDPDDAVIDAGSVFNTDARNAPDFSANDKLAIRNLYPATLNNTNCRAPFYYYWSTTLADALFTWHLTELGNPASNYQFQKIECYINTAQILGTIPLYRYYNSSVTDHRYMTTFHNTIEGYNYQKVAGYLYQTGEAGRVPLYEYYSSDRTSHFYTVNWNLLREGADSYVYQGIIGYVYTSR